MLPLANEPVPTNSPCTPSASMLISCIRCRQLHSPIGSLDFNPVCPACAGRLGSVGR